MISRGNGRGRHFEVVACSPYPPVNRFGDSPVLLPRRIELAFRSGNKGQILPLRTRCMQFEIKDLNQRCVRAAATGDQSAPPATTVAR